MTETDAWHKLEKQIAAAEQAQCKPYDDAPSESCKTILEALRSAAQELKKTPQWDALTQTDAYEALHKDYKRAHKKHCWQ